MFNPWGPHAIEVTNHVNRGAKMIVHHLARWVVSKISLGGMLDTWRASKGMADVTMRWHL